MKVADIMTRAVVTAKPDLPVVVLAQLLHNHKISAAPVVDSQDHLIGIISEADLLGCPPKRSPRGWWLRLFDDEATFLDELATARGLKVKDLMTRRVISVSDQTPLDIVATLMQRHGLKRVPVVQDGRLVGIVSRADLLDAFAGTRLVRTVGSLGDLD